MQTNPTRTKRRDYQRDYMRKFRARKILIGVCPQCGVERLPVGASRCPGCALYQRGRGCAKLGTANKGIEKRESLNTNARLHTLRVRADVYRHYGHGQIRCACCGEREIACLSLDHIDGGGTKHRRENPNMKCLAKWAKQSNYPPIFQVLCMNCNRSKYVYGECHHRLQAERDVV